MVVIFVLDIVPLKRVEIDIKSTLSVVITRLLAYYAPGKFGYMSSHGKIDPMNSSERINVITAKSTRDFIDYVNDIMKSGGVGMASSTANQGQSINTQLTRVLKYQDQFESVLSRRKEQKHNLLVLLTAFPPDPEERNAVAMQLASEDLQRNYQKNRLQLLCVDLTSPCRGYSDQLTESVSKYYHGAILPYTVFTHIPHAIPLPSIMSALKSNGPLIRFERGVDFDVVSFRTSSSEIETVCSDVVLYGPNIGYGLSKLLLHRFIRSSDVVGSWLCGEISCVNCDNAKWVGMQSFMSYNKLIGVVEMVYDDGTCEISVFTPFTLTNALLQRVNIQKVDYVSSTKLPEMDKPKIPVPISSDLSGREWSYWTNIAGVADTLTPWFNPFGFGGLSSRPKVNEKHMVFKSRLREEIYKQLVVEKRERLSEIAVDDGSSEMVDTDSVDEESIKNALNDLYVKIVLDGSDTLEFIENHIRTALGKFVDGRESMVQYILHDLLVDPRKLEKRHDMKRKLDAIAAEVSGSSDITITLEKDHNTFTRMREMKIREYQLQIILRLEMVSQSDTSLGRLDDRVKKDKIDALTKSLSRSMGKLEFGKWFDETCSVLEYTQKFPETIEMVFKNRELPIPPLISKLLSPVKPVHVRTTAIMPPPRSPPKQVPPPVLRRKPVFKLSAGTVGRSEVVVKVDKRSTRKKRKIINESSARELFTDADKRTKSSGSGSGAVRVMKRKRSRGNVSSKVLVAETPKRAK